MRIGIIGNGIVGHATAKALVEHVSELKVYDAEPSRSVHTLPEVLSMDHILLCLPEAALPAVLGGMPKGKHYIVRSSTSPGTCGRLAEFLDLHISHWPEFLTARCSELDAQMPSRNLLGYGGCTDAKFGEFCRFLEARFPCPVLVMPARATELAKIAQNALFAIKVAAWNELHGLATALYVDWSELRQALLLDSRMHPSHTMVPGPDGHFGFGGSCLPKDLQTYISAGRAHGVAVEVAAAANSRNKEDRCR
jgi:UDP-glucose 6-dehydrogenase